MFASCVCARDSLPAALARHVSSLCPPTCLPAHLPTCLPACLRAHLPACLPAQSLNNLAVVLTSQGKAGEALSLLQAAISACPTYAGEPSVCSDLRAGGRLHTCCVLARSCTSGIFASAPACVCACSLVAAHASRHHQVVPAVDFQHLLL